MSGRIATAALLLAAIAAPANPTMGREPKRQRVEASELPSWLRDAVAHPASETWASAIWLYKELIIQPLAAGGVRSTRRTAAKILAPRALSAIAECDVGYGSLDKIERLAAWTVLPNGEVWLPDPVRDMRDDPKTWGYEIGTDFRIRRLVPSRAAVGGIVACESVVVSSLDPGAADESFGAADEPTVYQRFALEVPKGWGKAVVPRPSDGLEIREDVDSIAVVATELHPLAPEEHRPPAHAILPRAWVRWWSADGARGFRDWNSVAQWNEALTAEVGKQHGGADSLADRLKPNDASEFLGALEKAFDFAARDVRYVAIELGVGGWKPHAPAVVVDRRFGDCKDKAFLLKAILDRWGVSSFPVDVRTSDIGPLEPSVPTFAQFDHMILAVPLPPGIGGDLWSTSDVPGLGRVVFLDATASDSSPWTPREDVQGTKALVYKGSDAFIVEIPAAPPAASRTWSEVSFTVNDQAVIVKGTSEERWFGIAAAEMRSYFGSRSENERRHAWSELHQAQFPGSTIALTRLDGLDKPLDPIDARAEITAGRGGRRVENMLILEPGRGTAGVVTQALAPPPRRYPLDLEHAGENRTVVHVTVPAGWTPEEVPAPIDAAGDLFTGAASWSFADGVLTYTRSATLKVASIPVERYSEFRSAVGRLRAADARGIVFVRKP